MLTHATNSVLRVIEEISRLPKQQFHLIRIIILVALILFIVGATSVQSSPPTGSCLTTKVGVILYLVAYAGILVTLLMVLRHHCSVPRQERRIGYAVALASPLILTRLIYSALAILSSNHLFSILDGSMVWQLLKSSSSSCASWSWD